MRRAKNGIKCQVEKRSKKKKKDNLKCITVHCRLDFFFLAFFFSCLVASCNSRARWMGAAAAAAKNAFFLLLLVRTSHDSLR